MRKKVLLDTDMGNDCDDAGALAMLCGFARRGACEIVGVAESASKPFAPSCVKAIADDYGLSFPIGALRDGFDAQPDYYSEMFRDVPAKTEEYVGFYRRLLTGYKGITLIAIGSMHGLDLVLRSQSDEISPLSGAELFAQSVACVYAMCGRFDGEAEWNVAMDISAAKYFLENCPSPLRICPFEAGFGVLTGGNLRKDTAAGRVYASFCRKKDGVRDSWDPLTAYAAVDGEKCRIELCELLLSDDGIMTKRAGLKHAVVWAEPGIGKLLDRLMF